MSQAVTNQATILSLERFLVDVSGNLEFGGKTEVKLIVGDALFHPSLTLHSFGSIQINGIPEPERGDFNDRYLEKVSPSRL